MWHPRPNPVIDYIIRTTEAERVSERDVLVFRMTSSLINWHSRVRRRALNGCMKENRIRVRAVNILFF
jgi:hypothetical protein